MKTFSYIFVWFWMISFPLLAQVQNVNLENRLKDVQGKERVDLLNRLGKEYENAEPIQARNYVQEALELSKAIRYPLGEAQAHKNIGNIYLLQGNTSQALEYFLRALQVFESIQNKPGIAETLNNIGIVYQKLRNYKEAEHYYLQTLEIDEETNDKQGQASTLNNIGDIYYQQDKLEAALRYYNRSMKIRKEMNDQAGVAVSLKNIGLVYYDENKYREALENYFLSLEIDRDLDNNSNIAATLDNIASSYLKLEKIDSALIFAEQSLYIAESLDLKQEIIQASFTLADIHATLGNFKEAYQYQLEHIVTKDDFFNEDNKKKIKDLQTSYELERERLENTRLSQENELLSKTRQRNILFIIALAGGLILVSTIVIILYRANRQKLMANQLLKMQNAEIIQQKEEILAQRDAIEKQRDEIERKNTEIKRKNHNIESSILYAQRIQNAILPYEDVIDQTLPLNFIYYRPRDVVSGDFYYFAKVEPQAVYEKRSAFDDAPRVLSGVTNEKIVLAAIDCTGHGVPGAFMSMIGDSLMNQIVIDKKITQTDVILEKMDAGVRKALKQSESHNRDGMDMALCVIDQESKTIEYAGAKNPLVYMKDKQLHEIKGSIYSVGGWSGDVMRNMNFKKHTISYADSPITLYLFSDGYQDQLGGPDDKKFMRRRFKELLLEIHQEPMTYQYHILDKTLKEWMGSRKQLDDILVMGVRLE